MIIAKFIRGHEFLRVVYFVMNFRRKILDKIFSISYNTYICWNMKNEYVNILSNS